jgi:hypothetical protein
MDYAETVSTLAFVTALGALAWNIVRDFISDRVSIDFNVAFGEVGNIKNTGTTIFADAGSLVPTHKFDMPGMMVLITNKGKKSIGIAGIAGSYKNGDEFSIVVDGLPKILQPYEVFSSTSNAKTDFINQIEKGNLKKIWVRDTQEKRWYLSNKGWERLRNTANYIASEKHL